jgi:hypothetical protein
MTPAAHTIAGHHVRAAVRLLPFLVLAIASAALAQPAETEVLRDGSFVVLSDFDLPRDKAKEILGRVKAAYAFVTDDLKWEDKEVLARDVRVRVLSDRRMKEITKGKGLAIGKDEFAVAASFLQAERSERTLAHELSHLQDRRHLPTKGAKLPHWFNEGKAIEVGRAYETKLAIVDPKGDSGVASVISTISVAEAKKILEEEAYVSEKKMASVHRMEALGFFFLDLVRATGAIEDLDARLARVVTRVGKGATFDDAFAAEVGKTLPEELGVLYQRLESSQGAARFEGTTLQRK